MRGPDPSNRCRTNLALWLVVSALGVSGLAGCGDGARVTLRPRPKRLRPGAQAAVNDQVQLARASLSTGELKQHDNGFGLMIADPETGATDAALRPFGRGCARWLRFAVGSQGELGRAPIWMTAERVLLELENRKAHVTLDEAARFANTAGVTHAAIGRLSGTPANCTLELDLYSVPDRKSLGTVRASGSTQAVLDQLPALARELCKKLGVSQPRIADKVEEAPDELAFLGSLPRTVNEEFTPAQELRLSDIADRSLLGAQMALDHASTLNDEGTMIQRADQLAAKAPDNPLVWSNIAQSFYNTTTGETPAPRRQAIEALAKRYPQNFNVCMAKLFMRFPGKTWKDAVQLAEEAVRCSASNPDAWATLGSIRSRQADDLRQGRDSRRISAAEWQVLPLLYDRWMDAIQHQMRLDPEALGGWHDLSSAATFAGEQQIAVDALWKSLNETYPAPHSFWWAYQMFDPKWFGDESGQRLRVAKRAVAANYRTSANRLYVARVLSANGFAAQAKALVRSKAEEQVLTEHKHEHSQNLVFVDPPPSAEKEDPVVREHPDFVQAAYEHPQGARCVAWSADGEQLATGGKDHTVRIWRWPSGQARVLQGHTRAVNAVAWNADGSRVATAGADGTIRIWDARSGTTVKILALGGQPLFALAWSPDGKTLASGGEDRLIRLWDGASGAPKGVLRGHEGRIRYLSYSPDGRYLASAADEMREDRICFWSTEGAHPVKRFAADVLPFYSMAWSPDGKVFAVAGRENLLTIAPDAAQPAPEPPKRYLGAALWFTWSTDASKLLLCSTSRSFSLVNPEGEAQVVKQSLPDHTKRAQAFAWNPKHQRLATAGSDGQVLLWDLGKTMLKEMR